MDNISDFVTFEKKLTGNEYYHAFLEENMLSMLENGILSNYLQGKKSNGGYNGKYYVSLCKQNDEIYSAYNTFVTLGYNMFIISPSVCAIHAKKNRNPIFSNSRIPYRASTYVDEYHVLYKVNSRYINGIRLSNKYDLIKLRELVKFMIDNNIYLPIYDYTYEKDGIIREVSKERVLK